MVCEKAPYDQRNQVQNLLRVDLKLHGRGKNPVWMPLPQTGLLEHQKAAKAEDAAGKFAGARRQAGRYAKGALAGIELTRYRYAVVVSERYVEAPGDLRDGSVIYRHINIAVSPRTPSRR